jgi:cellulose synthase/poly-beta-1,6-N-acetylglucosamine synthase-like glycosyltransferase
MVVLKFLFWTSAAAIFHSYILYPVLLKILSFRKKQNQLIFEKEGTLPIVSILIAAYNEEKVIAEKIESVFKTNYPKEKIEVFIGSDNSSDRTNEIVKHFCNSYPQIHLEEYKTRKGKTVIINELFKKTTGNILIITDANVIFEENTLYELVKHFKNDTIALADSNMINKGMKKEGISVQEKTYIEAEVAIKNAESKLWGCMMGPFGGCYAVRKSFFSEIPAHFLVDDFYVNMKVLEQGGKCINEINARVYEDVSNNLKEEFRRKVRIATGNFQNLSAFSHLLFKFNIISFCFFSHKVLRWLGPLFMIIVYFSSLALSNIDFYKYVFILQSIFYVVPLLDYLLKKANLHLSLLRFITHLLAMNLALFVGMIKYFRGVDSSVWEPTQRHQ